MSLQQLQDIADAITGTYTGSQADELLDVLEQLASAGSSGAVSEVYIQDTGNGYTDGTYTNVGTTSSENGTGATLDVEVIDGGIDTITVNTGGSGYIVDEELILDESIVGSGSDAVVTVNDIEASSGGGSVDLTQIEDDLASLISSVSSLTTTINSIDTKTEKINKSGSVKFTHERYKTRVA